MRYIYYHDSLFNNIDTCRGARLSGSSGINGTQIFVCYCDRVLGHRYLLWLKIFAVPFLPLDPAFLVSGGGGGGVGLPV